MDMTTKGAGTIIAIALIVSIATQIFYMATLGGPQPSDPAAGVTHADVVAYFTERWAEIAAVWMIELAAFALIAIAALVAMTRGAPMSWAWGALALAGAFNLIQLGMGLAMFKPAATGGAELQPVLDIIVSGAFFFYFLAKALIGLAGIGFGLALWREPSAMTKVVAISSILVGAAAAIANIATLPQGMALIFPAGATGTAAALFTGLAAMLVARQAGAKE
ncbi:hypothetical protein [Parasphingopyxis marina]|uniref:DUF4386 family protein n=1 Tax=Parasphingopyxis marina TaxID=2761622 RepID=A0A842I026_9SPHN|nr:hypothetical protein [Parasphingopyxis marina]MBC2778177.1 hypothetical protein [Parasphingopyxis marina]